jgi:hypothetical protein
MRVSASLLASGMMIGEGKKTHGGDPSRGNFLLLPSLSLRNQIKGILTSDLASLYFPHK